jgi:[ribosomal protein S18]-alanine N-acetyltransferase
MNGAKGKMNYSAENMDEILASKILKWQYEQPYEFYNNDYDIAGFKELFENNYSVVLNQNRELFGFFCVGSSAQVPSGEKVGAYTEDIIDIGLGMAPAFTGKGNGLIFFSFILETLCKTYGNVPVRLTVAAFNERAIHLYEKCGFIKEMEFATVSAKFQTMRRDSLCLGEDL